MSRPVRYALPALTLALALSSLAAASDGDGTAEIAFHAANGLVASGTDVSVPVDTRGTWVVTYTAGPSGMSEGGGIEILRRGQWDFRLGTVKQSTDPTGEDYCTAHASVPGVTVEIAPLGGYFKDQHIATLRLAHGSLEEGDSISLVVGDARSGGPGSVVIPVRRERRPVRITSDTDGDGTFRALESDLHVSTTAGPAVRFDIVAPSTVVAGEEFSLLIRAEDHEGNVAPSFRETVRIECSDPDAAFPETVEIGAEDAGKRRFRALLSTPGFHRFKVTCIPKNRPPSGVPVPLVPILGFSNPVGVYPQAPKRRLYWGDFHVHTFESDGTGTPDGNYEYARETAGLDFCAVTDHLVPRENGPALDGTLGWEVEVGFHRPVTVDEWWRNMLDASDRAYRPGEFATFSGYEWSGGSNIGGDHNLIFGERQDLVIDRDLDKVYARLRELDTGDNLFINPHVGGRIGNWDWHDDEVEPVAEINSVHGHFEWFGQEALERGYRIGFIGAGDGHHGRPGYSIWQRFGRMGFQGSKTGVPKRAWGVPGGIAGVYAEDLTREGIIRAVRERRCYATTGVRIFVDYRSGNHEMGSEFAADGPPAFQWLAVGTAPLDRIDLIRNERRVYTQEGERQMLLQGSFSDEACPAGTNDYYIRVTQIDGELAWASPIRVECATGPARREEAREAAWNDDGTIEDWLERYDWQNTPDFTAEAVGHLETRAPGRFRDLVQVRVVGNVHGRYALLLGYDGADEMKPVRVRYYPDFTEPRFHIIDGWGDYGPVRK